MWSFYFVILDFLGESLPWRACKDNKPNDVRDLKTKCLDNPERYLWKTSTANMKEIKNIFKSIQRLDYADKPGYEFIREQLTTLLRNEECGRDIKPYPGVNV
jgi:hypothetical protein